MSYSSHDQKHGAAEYSYIWEFCKLCFVFTVRPHLFAASSSLHALVHALPLSHLSSVWPVMLSGSDVALNRLFNNLALIQIIAGLAPLKQIRVPSCLSPCQWWHALKPLQLIGREDMLIAGHFSLWGSRVVWHNWGDECSRHVTNTDVQRSATCS